MNNIDKKLQGRENLKETTRLADLEKEMFDVEQNLADTLKELFEKEKKPGQSLIDWMKSKPTDFFKRIQLGSGGKVINFADYAKGKDADSKIRKLDIASHFTSGKTLGSLTEAEKEVVNNLLRMSFGKGDK